MSRLSVELFVGDPDQRRITRAVVPLEHPGADAARLAQCEDALHLGSASDAISRLVLLVDRFVRPEAIEERRGRQLFLIANDHDLSAPSDSPQRILGSHLAGLVHN